MIPFREFIKEDGDWEYSQNAGSRTHVFTHKTTGDRIHVSNSTVYGKVKNSRLRDPSKTKWVMEVDHWPKDAKYHTRILSKSVPRAESPDARERKNKVAQSAIKHVQKHHGADISKAMQWI